MGDKISKVTIGITCFNAEDTISSAIESALSQDYPDFEIVIVDDGSQDRSVNVIQNAIANVPVARLIVHKENVGFAGALNTLIASARGQYLAIFDDDDYSHPTRVSCQIKRLLSYQVTYGTDMVVCHTARLQRYPNGQEFYEPSAGCVEGVAPHGDDMVRRILIGHLSRGAVGSLANCSRTAPLHIFKSLGGFDENLRRCEDTDFNIRFALAGGHFLGISDPLVVQTMTGGSDKTLEKEYASERKMIEKHRRYLCSVGWYDFCVRWQDVKYANLSGDRIGIIFLLLRLFLRNPLQTLLKIYWAVPAHRTRKQMKNWYAGGGV